MAKIVRTRVRTLNVAWNQPRRGWYEHPLRGCSLRSVYEPGSRRLTVRYEKEKLPSYQPEGVGTGPLRGPVCTWGT